MTNKPFDRTKPYCRRDGKPAEIVYEGEKRYCYLTTINGDERFCVVNKNTGYTYEAHSSDYDLINIPEKIEGWQNVYKGRDGTGTYYSLGKVFLTREEALTATYGIQHFACIKVSFTEGEGLSDD